ncbi:SDR family oxidoreductase [Streptomyces sp. NPDC006670]|uniref:NAD-dependent epimerase/dehydratase family protein n=1 Tax=Streptomyces sp. NPDC006670 TaxID=3154476 RepID=UPI0034094CA8
MTTEIVGGGFLARYLRHHLTHGAPATILAAGVSDTTERLPERFHREAALVSETARRCRERGRLLVFLSSASTGLYGRRGEGREDTPAQPSSPYGRHKLAMERLVAESGARRLTLRLSHVVGPGQNPRQLLPSLAGQIRAGIVTVHRGASRDLIDVRHVTKVLDRLLARGVDDRTVNVASGTSVPAARIVTALETFLGRSAHWTFHDVPAETLAVSTRHMRALVPETAGFGFGPDYLHDLVRRYAGPTH